MVRAELLRLAMGVIDSEGEAGVRVNHLVEAAGVTPPTLYHYFGSRDGLIIEAQAERFVRSLRRDLANMRPVIAAVRNRRQMRRALSSMIDGLVDPARRSTRMARVNILGSAFARTELAARLAEAQSEVYGEFVEMFRPLQNAGLLRSDIHLPTAMYWMSGLFTSRFLVEIGDSEADPEKWNLYTRRAVTELLLGSTARP